VRIVRDDHVASVTVGAVLGEPVSSVVAVGDVELTVVVLEDEDEDDEDVAGRLVADSDVLGAGAA
jgi:hypothetical protein